MVKIGILGGTFDPVHNGHLNLAEYACRYMRLEEIYFLPTGQNPFKANPPIATPQERFQMLTMALEGHPKYSVLDWEIFNSNPSYTIDTVLRLKTMRSHIRFFWIIGSDLLYGLPEWKSIHELLGLIEFIVLERPEFPLSKIPALPGARLHSVPAPLINISSSEIREKLRNHEELPKNWLPARIENYMRIHSIYGPSQPKDVVF